MLNSAVVHPSPAADLFLASKLSRIDVCLQTPEAQRMAEYPAAFDWIRLVLIWQSLQSPSV
jgi:hypothetical protein